MTTLGGIAPTSDFPLTHTLLAYWRKLLVPGNVSGAGGGNSAKPTLCALHGNRTQGKAGNRRNFREEGPVGMPVRFHTTVRPERTLRGAFVKDHWGCKGIEQKRRGRYPVT